MKQWSGRILAVSSALLGLGASHARADMMPAYSYSWDQSPTTITSSNNGSGSISLSVGSGSAVGNSTIVAANISAITTTLAPNFDVYNAKVYTLTLSLKDSTSGQSAQFVFTGQLDGQINMTSSNLHNTWVGASSITKVIGSNSYTVSLGSFVPPPIVSGSQQGAIGASVFVTPVTSGSGGGGSGTQNAPEPATLLLTLLAIPAAGLARRRRTQLPS